MNEDDSQTTRECRYCGKTNWPYCMNSRDMEEMAIQGSERCFLALEKQGWGEAGERYVQLNREARLL